MISIRRTKSKSNMSILTAGGRLTFSISHTHLVFSLTTHARKLTIVTSSQLRYGNYISKNILFILQLIIINKAKLFYLVLNIKYLFMQAMNSLTYQQKR